MTTTHEFRITGPEVRMTAVDEAVNAHADTLNKVRRETARLRLNMDALLDHLGLPNTTAKQIDEALDAE